MPDNNKKTLYHGATAPVREPLTHAGRTDLDFGPGFYLTENRQQAIDWAYAKASRKRSMTAILNIYSFDIGMFNMQQYKRKIFTGYDVGWLDFIAQSRKGGKPWKEFDWIEGGIADDRVISTVDAYIDGMITAQQAMDRLVNEKLRHQVCISSQEIIDRYLFFTEAEVL